MMIFIESVEPGAVVLTDAPKFMEGHRALLGTGDVGALIRVLSDDRTDMKSLDGDFELSRPPDRFSDCLPCNFMGRICGEPFSLPVSYARVLRCALERACLDISRTRT